MSKHSDLDTRMKSYENCNKLFLQKRTPIIIRIDGRSFHSWTHGLEKPFDNLLNECMAKTAEHLLNNISGCQFAYAQSDEISLLLVDYEKLDTQPWFDNNQQKLVSLSAAMATLEFNRLVKELVDKSRSTYEACIPFRMGSEVFQDCEKTLRKYDSKVLKALFDSRAFNIPREDVVNYFISRQQDCSKNSISMLAQAHFSHRQLQGKNGSQMQDMLMLEKGINWNDLPTRFKRGVAVYKKPVDIKVGEGLYKISNKSCIDYEMPILTQDREFIKGY
jgi:tRNA(His) 5'-end guanylyltransferase